MRDIFNDEVESISESGPSWPIERNKRWRQFCRGGRKQHMVTTICRNQADADRLSSSLENRIEDPGGGPREFLDAQESMCARKADTCGWSKQNAAIAQLRRTAASDGAPLFDNQAGVFTRDYVKEIHSFGRILVPVSDQIARTRSEASQRTSPASSGGTTRSTDDALHFARTEFIGCRPKVPLAAGLTIRGSPEPPERLSDDCPFDSPRSLYRSCARQFTKAFGS